MESAHSSGESLHFEFILFQKLIPDSEEGVEHWGESAHQYKEYILPFAPCVVRVGVPFLLEPYQQHFPAEQPFCDPFLLILFRVQMLLLGDASLHLGIWQVKKGMEQRKATKEHCPFLHRYWHGYTAAPGKAVKDSWGLLGALRGSCTPQAEKSEPEQLEQGHESSA